MDDEIKNWTQDMYPTRALRWAALSMLVPIGYTQTLYKHGEIGGQKYASALRFLKENKKEYLEYIKSLGLKPTVYDLFI